VHSFSQRLHQLLNFIAFIPVTATLVSKANAKGNQEDVQDAVSQALIVGFYMSLVGTALMMLYPEKV
jgi:Na+-driven multidrug efflux pump